MKQKVAIVTGGTSGLGLSTAKQLIADGMHVIITGRNPKKLEETVAELGVNCTGMVMDMADVEHLPEFVRSVVSSFGRVDVLVNNAGINQKKPVQDVSAADFQNIMQVNTLGVFVLTREVAGVMENQEGKGNIVFISSMAAQYGLPYVIAYTASKTAIEGMTRALAVELGPRGIRINAVAPGFILTPMSSKALDSDPARKERVLAKTPLGHLGEPQDIADAVSFLVSDRAKFIHGTVLIVDGGNSIGF